MSIRVIRLSSIGFLLLSTIAFAAPPAARKIPGINAPDPYAKACVDCHVKGPDRPAPLSVIIKQWNTKVDPSLLAKAQSAAPKGLMLKGKHFGAPATDVPASCLKCHAKGSKVAPPFATMMHAIHLTGGDANSFMTTFQGECTDCHKLNAKTGEWSIPSGPEK
jgi:hypothetical protein